MDRYTSLWLNRFHFIVFNLSKKAPITESKDYVAVAVMQGMIMSLLKILTNVALLALPLLQ